MSDVLVVDRQLPDADLTIDCLRSLEPEVAGPGAHARGRPTTPRATIRPGLLGSAIRENGWGAWAEWQPLDRNGGFAFGNNAAIAPALASADPPGFVWLLNPDTIVRPGRPGASGRFPGNAPASRAGGEPAGGHRRQPAMVGVPLPLGPGRVRQRPAIRAGLAGAGQVGQAPLVPDDRRRWNGWPAPA